MKLLLSIVLALAAAFGSGVAGAAGPNAAPAQLTIYLYSAGSASLELFAVDFTMPEGRRNEPVELFREARAQCKRMGFVTARRTEIHPAVLKVQDRQLSGSLVRYACTNSL